MSIVSPLTLKEKVKLVENYDSEKTINLYNTIGLDVREYFANKTYSLFECVDTGYRFYHPPTILGDSSFYEELSRNRENYYSARWEHTACLEFIDKEDLVLEVGSGFGSFLKQLKNQNVEAKGIELNPHAVEYCTQQGLKVENNLLEDLTSNHKEVYDVICSFQVMEHIYDVNSFLKHQIDFLKPGGKLIVGVPNSNPFLFVSDKYHTLNLPPHHAGLWNKKSLESLEKVFPFQLQKIKLEPLDYSYDYFIQYHMQKNESKAIRKSLSFGQKFFPNTLKGITCSYFEGRNILAVFKKL